jgi:FkbM family methyltransferase
VPRLTSFEPDPANVAILEKTASLNHAADRWLIEPVAVSCATGTMAFVSGQYADSRQAEPGETSMDVEAVDLFSLHREIDLLKMDIEGGEWAILCDPRMGELGARVIVMEWHWRFAPQEDAHGAALALLKHAGYEIYSDQVRPSGHIGLIWASRVLRT